MINKPKQKKLLFNWYLAKLKLEESTSTLEIFQNIFARLLNIAKKFDYLI